MRKAQEWFDIYSATHRHPTNQRIHFICVPLILWSVLALLWVLPRPQIFENFALVNWATLMAVAALVFYFRLGIRYFIEMAAVATLALALILAMKNAELPVGWIAAIIFILAWIGQFYGHMVEGKKPSFFDDLFFLLIGPLWIIEKVRSR